MNIVEALKLARDQDTLVRRASWPKDKALFYKDGDVHLNDPEKDKWEVRLTYFLPESVAADDWQEDLRDA